ncbi:MAG TPA: outer membrane protein assembly factor BamA [Vicinamibacterales bacterium]|nr:outer membrane protein assembly factor BamA [Vicinamibacterales bacterium]
MLTLIVRLCVTVVLLALPGLVPGLANDAEAQTPPAPQQAQPQAPLPPTNIGPVLRGIELRIVPENVFTAVPSETYLYYIRTQVSQPLSRGTWVPYNETTEASLLADFDRLFATPFVDDLRIEVVDSPYPNGVIGKHVIFFIEERRRIKIVDYPGSKEVATSDIDTKLKELNIEIKLDSPVDDAVVRRVAGVVKSLYADKGYQYATVTPTTKPVAGGPKLVHLSFNINPGPKVQIREVVFDGNTEVSDGDLRKQLKSNKPKGALGFISGGGTYKEDKFADDAQALQSYFRDKGYVFAQVGQPQIEPLQDSADGKTRWVRLRIPVDERSRYRIKSITIAGNDNLPTPAIMSVFTKVKPGDYYSDKPIRKGYEKLREFYGSAGYWEFTMVPEVTPNDRNMQTGDPIPGFTGQPEVDVVLKMEEGVRYFLNRLTFAGNTTTRDSVIRREMRLVEGGIFNMESLKFSIRRLNQLGYFKPLESEDSVKIEKTPNADGKVDVRLKFEEQNRNQLSFGAGISQFEGFFGQLGFQTSNLMGRGETLSISAQKGSQARNYQLAFTEPFLFDRPITAGVDVYSRQVNYLFQFTQGSTGANVLFGFPIRSWSRFFIGYSLEKVSVSNIADIYSNPAVLDGNPLLRESLLIDSGGKRIISKVSPSIIYNTVNEPIFPTSGTKYAAAVDIAGLGGDTSFLRGRIEGTWYFHATTRTSFGFRAQSEYIRPYGDTRTLPIFEKLVLGGEYSLRGFDLRSVGTRDPRSGLVLGGNKTLLFNAEYMINVGGPVRLVFFYDAGQVRDIGQSFTWKETIFETVPPPAPLLSDPLQPIELLTPVGQTPGTSTQQAIGRTYAFKSSLGSEIRFFMPVLNVPFRLIFAYNPQRGNVFNNNLQRQQKFTFRFAVGTTF